MNNLRVNTCCFTGHRIIPSGEKETIRNLLETAIEKAIQDGYRFFGAGGALGFDTLAAQTVLTLKQQADTCPAVYQSSKRMETG